MQEVVKPIGIIAAFVAVGFLLLGVVGAVIGLVIGLMMTLD